MDSDLLLGRRIHDLGTISRGLTTRCDALAAAESERLRERDARLSPGNDAIWGVGNWVSCTCSLDSKGDPVYHHKNAHD